jgi:hypothetical protein
MCVGVCVWVGWGGGLATGVFWGRGLDLALCFGWGNAVECEAAGPCAYIGMFCSDAERPGSMQFSRRPVAGQRNSGMNLHSILHCAGVPAKAYVFIPGNRHAA